jgi:5-(carboxyamino)imidazole ribonucleotide synthase
MTRIPPGATIGILGGGQLGRMTALAARSMGYRIHVLDPDANCSAAPVADRVVAASFDDVEAARELARHCAVVTLEIEQIATAVLEAAAELAPTRPGSTLIAMVQDRARQKEWLTRHGFPVAPWRAVSSAADVEAAVGEFGRCIVKTCRGGYDGRGQVRVENTSEAAQAWRALAERPSVGEQTLSLAAELSVMVARSPSGRQVVYPAALNHHERLALSWSVIPAPLPPDVLSRANEIGRGIAESAGLEGLIGVELFLTTDGNLLVNELAPRPHNSYHASERACVTGQFEQLARAVCDLPLGDVSIVRPGAIVNIFGDLWRDGREPDFARALEDGAVRLHLYGKPGPRPARKMGHLSALGDSPIDALRRARDAAARVGAVTEDVPTSVRGLIT